MSTASRLDQVSGILQRHVVPKMPADRGLIPGAVRTLHEVRGEVSEMSLLLDRTTRERNECLKRLDGVSDRKTIEALDAVVRVLSTQLIEQGYRGTHRTEIYRAIEFVSELRTRLEEGRWKMRP